MIILIVSKQGRKYWTKEYKMKGDFFQFSIKTKAGEDNNVLLHKDNVMEISEVDKEFNELGIDKELKKK